MLVLQSCKVKFSEVCSWLLAQSMNHRVVLASGNGSSSSALPALSALSKSNDADVQFAAAFTAFVLKPQDSADIQLDIDAVMDIDCLKASLPLLRSKQPSQQYIGVTALTSLASKSECHKDHIMAAGHLPLV